MTEAEVLQRLASVYAGALEVTRKHGLPDATAAQAMGIAAIAVLIDACGPVATAAFLRQAADRIERDGGPPEFH